MVLLLIAYILLRLIVSFWSAGNSAIDLGDQSTYRYWSALLTSGGFSNFYNSAKYFPYPPVANYLFFLIGKLAGPNVYLYNVLLRLPGIAGDLLIALLLYKLSGKRTLAAFYLLQPAAFFIGSVWGQLDSLIAVLVLLSFYLLLKKRVVLGYISLLLAFLIKPQVMPFLLPIATIRKSLTAFSVSVILFFILFFPFFSSNPIFGPYDYFKETLRDFSPRFTSSAFNFWYLLYGGWKDVYPALLGFSLRRLSRIITAIFILLCSFYSYKSKSVQKKSLAVALSGFAFFLFFTQVKERYLFTVIPFLGLYSLPLGVIVSLLFAVNSLGFFIGWVGFGLWNSTFLSGLNIDKIVALGFLIMFFAYLKRLLWQKDPG